MQRPGCLLFLPIYAIASVVAPTRAIGTGPALPAIPWQRVHTEDRPSVAKARAAAEASLAALAGARKDLGPQVTGAVAVEVARLLERVIAVAEELQRARRFVAENDPAALGRERADIEIRQLEASSLHEKRALDEALGALAERGKHAGTVQTEIGVLRARLLAAAASFEALQARLTRAALTAEDASTRARNALAELTQQEQDARRALEAYAATAREIGRLSKGSV